MLSGGAVQTEQDMFITWRLNHRILWFKNLKTILTLSLEVGLFFNAVMPFWHFEAISQVPFPEVKRIEEQAQKLYPQCPKEDMVRNVPHEAKLFVFTTNPLVDCLDSGTNSQNSDILPFNVLFADSCVTSFLQFVSILCFLARWNEFCRPACKRIY